MDEKVLTAWLGQWEIVISKEGKEVETMKIKPNLIMDAGLNLFRDFLRGTVTDGQIKYVALGSDSTAAAEDQTQLVAEQFRKTVTSQTPDPTVQGRLFTELYLADTEANAFRCEEIGWFAGTGTTSAANSGTMIARVLFSRQKAATESWTIRRTDTISRG